MLKRGEGGPLGSRRFSHFQTNHKIFIKSLFSSLHNFYPHPSHFHQPLQVYFLAAVTDSLIIFFYLILYLYSYHANLGFNQCLIFQKYYFEDLNWDIFIKLLRVEWSKTLFLRFLHLHRPSFSHKSIKNPLGKLNS